MIKVFRSESLLQDGYEWSVTSRLSRRVTNALKMNSLGNENIEQLN